MGNRCARIIGSSLVAAVLAFGTAGASLATPAATDQTSNLDDATQRALTLEDRIEAIRAEQVAIAERLEVTNLRIFRQQETLAAAREFERSTWETYSMRLVRIYKTRLNDPLSLLLDSESIGDFYARAFMLGRIADRDRAAYRTARVAAAEAEYQAAFLDDLKQQDLELRGMQERRLDDLTRTLDEQRTLIERLSVEARAALQERRALIAQTRAEWRASSIPSGTRITLVEATVEPHTGVKYLVPEHQPTAYRALGRTATLVCSWYGNEFHGRPTASGQIFNEEDLTCASRTLSFGTRLALTRGERRIIVVVNDRGPFIAGRDLDLSKAAARALGFSGVQAVHVEWVEALPPVSP